MLKMTIDPTRGRSVEDQLAIEAPYEFVVGYIGDDIQFSLANARIAVDELRRALAGTPVRGSTGNAWRVDADASKATLTVIAAGDDEIVHDLPTAVLLDALERWLAYLETRSR
jgi:hypothetical protein